MFPLATILDVKEFKSFDDLQKRLTFVLGNVSGGAKVPTNTADVAKSDSKHQTRVAAASAGKTAESKELPSSKEPNEEEDDDFFAKLAAHDGE